MDATALSQPPFFGNGARVFVLAGRFVGEHGDVVDRAPDLRPGTVWVEFARSGPHLVPAYRLSHCADDPDCGHVGAGSGPGMTVPLP